ncbi:tetratricopeptide (TPR) repeat protein [Bacillus ectoiniformans]|uniref:hypothetical protein n=1 Tax=Bacillus ectoiniformans TaxID=1494429 RepID=UPI001956867E|nr:hypothetical protein [Bacillus ectoiniformans]MBM7649310.1 tetratricopeptide (TPR) repeat protein [Bacillus ectoiniformans]
MRKLLIILAGALVLLAAGCSSSPYDEKMKSGLEAMKEERYQDAVSAYEEALEAEETNEAKQSAAAAKHMAKARDDYAKGNYKQSMKSAKKVMNDKSKAEAVKTVKPQAKRLYSLAKKAGGQIAEVEEELQRGKDLLAAGKYQEAEEAFTSISRKDLGKGDGQKVVDEAARLMEEAKDQELDEAAKKPVEKPVTPKSDIKKPADSLEPFMPVEPGREEEGQENDQPLTIAQSEQLVSEYLAITEPNVQVRYDHSENGDYIIQVYEMVIDNPDTGEGHSATWGWYGVNPRTKEIYEAFQ